MNTQTLYEEVYKRIESEVPTIADQLTVSVQDNGEGLVDLSLSDRWQVAYFNSAEMLPLVGEQMLIREQVADMLGEADVLLKSIDADLQFLIFYAYRAREVQEQYWSRACEKFRQELQTDDEELIVAAAQRLSADPRVAGHPTGGSIDLTLMSRSTGQLVDMGVGVQKEEFYRAGKKIYTMSPEITGLSRENRLLLKRVMTQVGFTAFAPEFWHFDYGNTEWAFLNETQACYAPLPVAEAKRRIVQR